MTIVETNSQKTIYSGDVSNPELLGRLKSQTFAISKGHIYYNNQLIKIRYDLLSPDICEHDVFDYYENILDLNENEKVL